jgi:hypothetical protein
MRNVTELVEQIRTVLLKDWDPIGIRNVPRAVDEYDEYAPPIARMLVAGTSAAELSDHLLGVERDTFGLTGDPDRARRAAAKLLNIRR